MSGRALILMAVVVVGCGDDTAGSGGQGADAGTGGSSGAGGEGGTGGSEPQLSFFVSSMGSGTDGGNFGGLEGADARCQSLADAVGAGGLTWRAYLSSSAEDARDRIGSGPWYNVDLVLVATDVEALHADGLEPRAPLADDTADTVALDENGERVPGGDHDIVTGSQADGTLFADRTCQDWTSSSVDDVAQVGHSDIPPMTFDPSWNSAHESASCTMEGLAERLGNGRVYCFAQ